MEIKQYHIYTMKHDLFDESKLSKVVSVQNNDKSYDYITVVPYVNGKFKGIHTIIKEFLVEDIGVLEQKKQEELKEYYYSMWCD